LKGSWIYFLFWLDANLGLVLAPFSWVDRLIWFSGGI
jgi:hypothetical protein